MIWSDGLTLGRVIVVSDARKRPNINDGINNTMRYALNSIIARCLFSLGFKNVIYLFVFFFYVDFFVLYNIPNARPCPQTLSHLGSQVKLKSLLVKKSTLNKRFYLFDWTNSQLKQINEHYSLIRVMLNWFFIAFNRKVGRHVFR